MTFHEGPGRPEFEPATRRTIDLQDGPLNFSLSYSDHLSIVDPSRDLDVEATGWNPDWPADCLIMSPNFMDVDDLDRPNYKVLSDGETVILGRRNNYDRFDFSPYVSASHVRISRVGDIITVKDLGSTNGTYFEKEEVRAARTLPTPTAPVPKSADVDKSYKLITHEGTSLLDIAGASIASEGHPDRNEDSYFHDLESGTVGVFDGMGGRSGSELASKVAAETVEKFLKPIPTKLARTLSLLAVREALESADVAIVQASKEATQAAREAADDPDDVQDVRIGTTATIAKIFESESGKPYVVIASAGDSRAYLFRNGHVEHLTVDHAYVGDLSEAEKIELQATLAQATDLNHLTDEQRKIFEHRNFITSCLGNRGPQTPLTITTADFEIAKGDQILLTSDGIHDNLTTDEITQILAAFDADQTVTVDKLVTAARDRSRNKGLHIRAKADDMTAVIMTYTGE